MSDIDLEEPTDNKMHDSPYPHNHNAKLAMRRHPDYRSNINEISHHKIIFAIRRYFRLSTQISPVCSPLTSQTYDKSHSFQTTTHRLYDRAKG